MPDFSVLRINDDPVIGLYYSDSGKIRRPMYQGIGRNLHGVFHNPPYYLTDAKNKIYKKDYRVHLLIDLI